MKRSRVALAWFLALYGALLAAVRVSGPSGVIASEVSRATRPGAEAGSHKLTTHDSELALDLYHPQCGLSYLWNRSGLPIQGPPSLAFHGPEQIRQFAPEALNHTSPVAERWQRRQLADQAQVEALARHFPKRKHPLQQREGDEGAEPQASIVLVILAGEPSHRPEAKTGFDDQKLLKLTQSLYHSGAIDAQTVRPVALALPVSHAWLNGQPAGEIGRTVAMLPTLGRLREREAIEIASGAKKITAKAKARPHWSVRMIADGVVASASFAKHTAQGYLYSAPAVAVNVAHTWKQIPHAAPRPAQRPTHYYRPTRSAKRGMGWRVLR